MNEMRALVEAFDAANARGERCALATVVSVDGSSYRRPGARMLVSEGGTRTGMISAGCLESDVIEHAGRVIRSGAAKLVEYDTASTSDEVSWGLGLGCIGIVRVLVEPLAPGSLYLEALRHSCAVRPDDAGVCVATVYQGTAGIRTGARLVIREEGEVSHENLSNELAGMLESEMRALPAGSVTFGTRMYQVDGATVEVFVEMLQPPVPLIVFGAGHDALPVVQLARELGWHTEVVDPQARTASRSRFAIADTVTLSRPEDAGTHISITSRTMALLMSHNYSHDLALLRFLLTTPARYIGVVGSRQRTDRMLRELAAREEPSRMAESSLRRLHAPAGLDIGANGPVEIALSILAEMRAVLDSRRGGMLRERRGSIHGTPDETARTLPVVAA